MITMPPSWFPSKEIPSLSAYDDFHKIGEGGLGEIYSALFHETGKTIPVVVKRLRKKTPPDPSLQEQMEREALFLKKISHPQIPRYLDGYLSEEESFLIMEKLEGLNLDRLVRNSKASGKKISIALCLEIIRKALIPLEYLHTFQEEGKPNPIFHGDLQPKNLIVSPSLQVYLLDFSHASQKDRPSARVGGTFLYMPPERYAGEAPTAQDDLFGLSLTLLYFILSQNPLQAKTAGGVFAKLLSKNLEKEIVKQAWPEALEGFLRKGLDLNPKNRFESAQAMAKALPEVFEALELSNDPFEWKKELSSLFKIH